MQCLYWSEHFPQPGIGPERDTDSYYPTKLSYFS